MRDREKEREREGKGRDLVVVGSKGVGQGHENFQSCIFRVLFRFLPVIIFVTHQSFASILTFTSF